MREIVVQGAKKGDKNPPPPYIAPDSLRSIAYADLLYAISEGEIKGLVNGMESVKLEGTPVSGGNFPGVKMEFRPGTINQEHISGFPDTASESGVGVELRSGTPWVRNITNTNLDAIRLRFSWPQLMQTKDNGDVVGYSIMYMVEVATDGGDWELVIFSSAIGKSSSKYERTHRVDLPKASSGWSIRVTRITPNADSVRIQDMMRIEAITEVIDAKLRYPNTALIGLSYDSQQFQNIAKFSAEVDGRIIQVPSNYDPETRTYTGIWDGTFKREYSNNPAWVWYDLVLHPRYGLGRRINASMVNKWKLYQIAQYCDVMVPDGKGGQEPRYTCNFYIQTTKQAHSLLAEIASIFHGASFWDGSQMVLTADMPEDPVYTFSRANIVEGNIEYKGTALRDRHSTAVVAWDDPEQGYSTMYEPVSDTDAIRQLGGVYQKDIGAFGCTSQGQAQRAGIWALKTEQLSTRVATFRVGLDGFIPRPGDIINVSDDLLAGVSNGGRIVSATQNSIVVDRLPKDIKEYDRLSVNLPSGRTQTLVVRNVETIGGPKAGKIGYRAGQNTWFAGQQGELGRIITFYTNFDEVPESEAVWAVDSDEVALMQFRVSSVRRVDEHQFEITAAQHVPAKYDAIDHGAAVEPPPISNITPTTQAPPTNVQITTSSMVEQTMAVTTMTISWDAVQGAVAYEVQWRKDNGEWVKLPDTGAPSIDVKGVYTGNYIARVVAIGALGVRSTPASSALTEVLGKQGQPPALALLEASPLVFGIRLRWAFAPNSEDTLRTEIQYSENSQGDGHVPLGDFAYPLNTHELMGLSAGKELFFRGRIVDRTGNVGPWTDWIRGQSSADASEILGYIAGKITETELGDHLLEEIEKISGDGEGSVNERLQQIQDEIDNISGAEDWDADTAYLKNNLVRYEGSMYAARQDVPAGVPVSNSEYWEFVGSYANLGELAGALSIRLTQTEIDVDELTGEVSAIANKTEALEANFNVYRAGATNWRAGQSTAKAGVYSVWTAIASGDEAVSKRVDMLRSEFDDSNALIATELETLADADSAMAKQIDTIAASVDDNAALIQQESQTRADETEALAGQINTVAASAQSAHQAADNAMAAAEDAQEDADLANQGVAQNTAAIQQEAQARADADQALASQVSTVQAEVGDVSSAVQQTSQAVADIEGNLGAMYSIKVGVTQDGRYYGAGMGAGVENTPDGMQSQILFTADRFAFLNKTNGQVTLPFAIEDGQTFIRSAVIKDASIGSAKFSDWLESDAVGPDNTPVLRLNFRTGEIQLNAPAQGGGRMTLNNQLLQVFDENNKLRLRLGIW